MLIEFRVENHRSLRDEQVLSMEAGPGVDPVDPRPRLVAGYPTAILPVAALYGANASGKSNVLDAMIFMAGAILSSHRSWDPEGGVPRDPFAWGDRSIPSLYEATLLIDGIRYQYGFTADDAGFMEEWLYAWSGAEKQVWFERDQGRFEFGPELAWENSTIAGLTRPNSLFLSTAVQVGHPRIYPIHRWFSTVRSIGLARSADPISGPANVARLNAALATGGTVQYTSHRTPRADRPIRGTITLDDFLKFMRNADPWIDNLRVIASESHPPDFDPMTRPGPPRFFLGHRGNTGDAWLPLEQESRGTQALFWLALPILGALESGGLLVIDELEASLHPNLARFVVGMFQDPESNSLDAQLIFATHDTNLLGTTLGDPALRRDQIWLTEKDKSNATVLYPLTDFKPSGPENLERGYLQGRYGAIPFLGNLALAGE